MRRLLDALRERLRRHVLPVPLGHRRGVRAERGDEVKEVADGLQLPEGPRVELRARGRDSGVPRLQPVQVREHDAHGLPVLRRVGHDVRARPRVLRDEEGLVFGGDAARAEVGQQPRAAAERVRGRVRVEGHRHACARHSGPLWRTPKTHWTLKYCWAMRVCVRAPSSMPAA